MPLCPSLPQGADRRSPSARSGAALSHSPSQLLRPLSLVAGALLLASSASAQGSGSSESGFVTAMGTGSVGGEAVGQVTGGQLSFLAGQPATGERAASTNFILESGIAWSASSFTGNSPVVTGTRPGLADKLGGETLDVFGFNFTAAGAGVNQVFFDGIGGIGENTLGNTQIRLTTPVGVNAFQNPLHNVDLSINNANGSYLAPDAMHFTPALAAANFPHLNREFKLRLHADPGSIYLLLFGTTIGVGVPIPPYSGQLELINDLFFVTPVPVAMPTGVGDFTIDMPGNPPLVGVPMEFQSLVLDPSLTSGAWTNRLVAVIQADN